MIRDTLERLLSGPVRHDWLGSAAVEVAGDLADADGLGDLFGEVDSDAAELLRASRVPRVRPVLVVLAARAAGGSAADPELQYAAELLHASLVLHDLALGQRGGRRRTLARSVLRGVGWLGSNRVLVRAMELARHAPTPEVLSELVDTLGAFHEGQEVAARLVAQGVPTLAAWSEHADGHTGALFAFCCRAGAQVGGCDEASLSAFGRYGRHLGRMWHVAEDLQLLRGDDAVEHLAGRALIGRPALAIAVAAERDAEVAALWRRVVDDHDLVASAEVLRRVRASKALQGTREVMVQEHWHARQALARLEATPYRHALERLVSGLSRAPYEDAEKVLP